MKGRLRAHGGSTDYEIIACSALLASLTRSTALIRSLARSLAHSLTPELIWKRYMSMNWTRRFRTFSTHCKATEDVQIQRFQISTSQTSRTDTRRAKKKKKQEGESSRLTTTGFCREMECCQIHLGHRCKHLIWIPQCASVCCRHRRLTIPLPFVCLCGYLCIAVS